MQSHSLKVFYRGSRRADFGDFSQSSFEIQVRYTTGWETIEKPSPFVVELAWWRVRKSYRTMRLRLLRNGRRVR